MSEGPEGLGLSTKKIKLKKTEKKNDFDESHKVAMDGRLPRCLFVFCLFFFGSTEVDFRFRFFLVFLLETTTANVGGAFGLGVGANLLNIIRAVLAAVVHVWRLVARSGNAAARSGNVAGVGSVAP